MCCRRIRGALIRCQRFDDKFEGYIVYHRPIYVMSRLNLAYAQIELSENYAYFSKHLLHYKPVGDISAPRQNVVAMATRGA